MAIALSQRVMSDHIPKILEVNLKPSEHNKSKQGEVFLDAIEILGFGRSTMASRIQVEVAGKDEVARSDKFNYTFTWSDSQEKESYRPLQSHLKRLGIYTCIVSDGQGLANGLLYHEELWTLRKNTSIRSSDLRRTGEEPVLKYTISGRTDLVRVEDPECVLGKQSIKYFIEVKRSADFKEEESLREAVLQLLGGNASNSFHSPPVLLTNLVRMHYVLFITLVGDPSERLQFKLNILKMATFGLALAYVEEKTVSMCSHTLHLGRKPTPSGSPTKQTDSDDDDNDIGEQFSSVALEEVVEDTD